VSKSIINNASSRLTCGGAESSDSSLCSLTMTGCVRAVGKQEVAQDRKEWQAADQTLWSRLESQAFNRLRMRRANFSISFVLFTDDTGTT